MERCVKVEEKQPQSVRHDLRHGEETTFVTTTAMESKPRSSMAVVVMERKPRKSDRQRQIPLGLRAVRSFSRMHRRRGSFSGMHCGGGRGGGADLHLLNFIRGRYLLHGASVRRSARQHPTEEMPQHDPNGGSTLLGQTHAGGLQLAKNFYLSGSDMFTETVLGEASSTERRECGDHSNFTHVHIPPSRLHCKTREPPS